MGISRLEFFARMGWIQVVEPLTEEAYRVEEQRAVAADMNSGWVRSSFAASDFPGDDPKACGRRAMYKLMNLPGQAFDRRGRAIFDAGLAIESALVSRWKSYGVLLEPPKGQHQWKLTLASHWLSGRPDAIIAPPAFDGDRPHLVEVKGKDHAKVIDMKKGQLSWDKKYRAQTLACVGLVRELGPKLLPDMKPCTSGSLYYASRDRPSETMEFYFDHDQSFWEAGLDRLTTWKKLWLDGLMPLRPKEWRWTEEPCKWCEFKKLCKQDLKEGNATVDSSVALPMARTVQPGYDLDTVRAGILARWNKEN